MRLLGKCPSCGVQDSISHFWQETSFADLYKVRCHACGKIWPDWIQGLVSPERVRGNKLVPVEVGRIKGIHGEEEGVRLWWPPIPEIPAAGMVIAVLNASLNAKFDFRACFTIKGGVEGNYKGCFVELSNTSDSRGEFSDYLGLYVGESDCQGPGLTEVLNFYEKMLRILFEQGFSLYGKEYRPGEILRFSDEEAEMNKERALGVLIAMLIRIEGKKFAQRAVRVLMGNASNPFGAPYKALVGDALARFGIPHLGSLSAEEIVRFSVPPLI